MTREHDKRGVEDEPHSLPLPLSHTPLRDPSQASSLNPLNLNPPTLNPPTLHPHLETDRFKALPGVAACTCSCCCSGTEVGGAAVAAWAVSMVSPSSRSTMTEVQEESKPRSICMSSLRACRRGRGRVGLLGLEGVQGLEGSEVRVEG